MCPFVFLGVNLRRHFVPAHMLDVANCSLAMLEKHNRIIKMLLQNAAQIFSTGQHEAFHQYG